jgi:hypothetical protein
MRLDADVGVLILGIEAKDRVRDIYTAASA